MPEPSGLISSRCSLTDLFSQLTYLPTGTVFQVIVTKKVHDSRSTFMIRQVKTEAFISLSGHFHQMGLGCCQDSGKSEEHEAYHQPRILSMPILSEPADSPLHLPITMGKESRTHLTSVSSLAHSEHLAQCDL